MQEINRADLDTKPFLNPTTLNHLNQQYLSTLTMNSQQFDSNKFILPQVPV